MRNFTVLLTVGLMTLGMTACSHFDQNVGSNVTNNTSEQVVDIVAPFNERSYATLDGQKAEKLLKEYRTETPTIETGTLLEGIGD